MKKLLFSLLFLASFIFINQAKASAPLPPVIIGMTSSNGNNIISPTTEEFIQVSGNKEQGTDIFVNGVYTNWPSDSPDSTSWHFNTPLTLGENKFIFTVKNIDREESSPVIVAITRNNPPELPENIPLPPVITGITSPDGKNIVSPTTEQHIKISGTKKLGTSISSNGYPLYAGYSGFYDFTEWFLETTLSVGENKFVFTATNRNTSIRNVSSPVTVIIVFNGVPELTGAEKEIALTENIKKMKEEIEQNKKDKELSNQNSAPPVLKPTAESNPSTTSAPSPAFTPQPENKAFEENLTKSENTVVEEFKPDIKVQEQSKKTNEGFFVKISNFLKNIRSRIWGWFN